jgi:6-phosphogluconate dehydrogenase
VNQIGIIGLGTMGAAIARNFARNNVKTAVYNRTTQVTNEFIETFQSEGPLTGFEDLARMVKSLEAPRKIMLFVTAGKATEAVISSLTELLEPNDIIVDGGNSNYKDTIIRTETLAKHKIEFIGCGVSGGEKGALEGPSLMPGGNPTAIQQVTPLLEKIAAKDFAGNPCVYAFEGIGSGNFIKTVHNGIEYAIMQLFADSYEILRKIYNLSAPEIADIFASFSKTKINGFLLETTIDVLRKKDNLNPDASLIDLVSDEAGAKGTGTWTVQHALEMAVPVPTIAAAVFARQLSASPEIRQIKAGIFAHKNSTSDTAFKLPSVDVFTKDLKQALWLCFIMIYTQGIHLLELTIAENNWNAPATEYLRVWQGGCIIRSEILTQLPTNEYLDEITPLIPDAHTSLNNLIQIAANFQLAIPSITATRDYVAYQSTPDLPTNLVQALRDAFGAHTFARKDKPGTFTEDWSS